MKKCCFLLLLLGWLRQESTAQFTRYVVKLKNKGGNSFSLSNPSAYLSPRALARRARYNIPVDSTDLPVTTAYLTQIAAIPNVTILNVSKWLNAVSIQTSDANAITAINALPFVQSTSGLAARNSDAIESSPVSKFELEKEISSPPVFMERVTSTAADFFSYGNASFNEINLHKGQFLHNIGLHGQGMQIAMLDNGFFNYTALRAFDSANANTQILGTWDFVAREQNVANDGGHGMQCFSTIAANIPGQFIGKAPKASFWLYRTEDDAIESPLEEHHWACAAERADSAGTDILSSSLGYGYGFTGGIPDYPYNTLDGNTTMAAIAADLAAKKGILVFISAGNAGNIPWHFITTPADADSVIAVGAVNTAGAVGSFSSYGPSGDGQVKPDMASVGVSALIQTSGNTIGTNNGTSFACPNMAGLGAILWQAFPEFNNMKIRSALRKAGSLAAAPNDRIGYGIPDLKKAFSDLLTEFATSSSSVSGCRVTVSWTSKDVQAMQYEVERMAPGETVYTKIGELTPQNGTTLSTRNYQFTNDLPNGSSGNYSYRIKQIIDTAAATPAFAYIDTTQLSIVTPCENGIAPVKGPVTVRPNPVSSGSVTLVVETPEAIATMTISFYDTKGALVLQRKESKGAGTAILEIPASQLPTGKYYIRVFNGNKSLGNAKIIKL